MLGLSWAWRQVQQCCCWFMKQLDRCSMHKSWHLPPTIRPLLPQYIDGLRGPLVINDPRDPAYEVDTPLAISEYRTVSGEAVTDILSATGVIVMPPVASLIDGVGQLESAGCESNPSGTLGAATC